LGNIGKTERLSYMPNCARCGTSIRFLSGKYCSVCKAKIEEEEQEFKNAFIEEKKRKQAVVQKAIERANRKQRIRATATLCTEPTCRRLTLSKVSVCPYCRSPFYLKKLDLTPIEIASLEEGIEVWYY
jgi:hypothetical protein